MIWIIFTDSRGGENVDLITDEFIHARTGEPLEARIRKNEEFQQQKKYSLRVLIIWQGEH